MSKVNLGKHLLARHTSAQPNLEARRKSVERDLINAESALGRTLFGAVPAGRVREFFCLKENVWLWYEDGIIIRYEVRKNGVYKRVGTENYAKISGPELEHFIEATKQYLKLVKTKIYHRN